MLSEQRIQEIIGYFSEKIKYKFKNPALLIQALTRPSARGVYVPDNSLDFERLEFVGDRVLNLAIATHLSELYPTATPSVLHQYYESYTRNSDASKRNGGPLYRVAKALQLEGFIIKADNDDLEKYASRGKRSLGKKSKEGHLSDHVEALLGALYEDSGHNMQLILLFVKQYWQHMGLNDDQLSESSFGESIVSANAATIQSKIKQDALLLQAATEGRLDKVRLALQNGASIRAIDENGQSVLHHFARQGKAYALQEMLSFPELDINLLDKKEHTALYYATEKGTADSVEALLIEGASIHIKINDGKIRSIFVLAAVNGHVPVITLLLKYNWHALLDKEIQVAIESANLVDRSNMEPHLKKAFVVKAQNRRMFIAAESIVEDSEKHDEATTAIKDSITMGANIYSKNAHGNTFLNLLKSMPMKVRFDLLLFILSLEKLYVSEIDLTDISAGVSMDDAHIVFPVYKQIIALKKANQSNFGAVEIFDKWLAELKAFDDSSHRSLISRMASLSIETKSVSKSASLHFVGAESSSSSPAKTKKNSMDRSKAL